LGEATDRFGFILSGVLRVVFYRTLHMVSVPLKPREVAAYAAEQAAGGMFGGTLREQKSFFGFLESWWWDGVTVGEGLTMDVKIFGFRNGPQTVIVRDHFFMGNFARDASRKVRSVFGVGRQA